MSWWHLLRKPVAPRTHAAPVSATLLATQHTPRRQGPSPAGIARYIGPRTRLATCSGVAWFHGEYLATVHLAGSAFHTYRWDSCASRLELVQTEIDMEGLDWPENVACAPDGSLLAVTNSRDGAVHLYPVDRNSHLVAKTAAARIRCDGDINTHGVSFSPCSRFLAFTTVDDPGYIRVHRIVRDAYGQIETGAFKAVTNTLQPLKPKGIDFSPNGRFVAICYAPNAGAQPGKTGGLIAVYSFNAETGLSPRPIARGGPDLGLLNPDDLSFLPDGRHLVVTNQENDTAAIVLINPANGTLGGRCNTLANPEAQLNFPHGTAVSPDGRYLAITNYGDDKLSIYRLTSG